MAFVIKTVEVVPNHSTVVNFDKPVTAYICGFSYYYFTYGYTDHHVKTLGLTVNASQPTSNQLYITVHGTLQDSSGHNVNEGSSKVNVSILAWVGTDSPGLTTSQQNNIPNNGQSGQIALPGYACSPLSAVLSGFNLTYSDGKDHHVQYVTSGVTANATGNMGVITGTADMGDDNGHSAGSVSTVNGALIAIAQGGSTNALFSLQAGKQTSSPLTVDFGTPITEAVVFVVKSRATFADDHHVRTVGAGTTGWDTKGNTVILNNARAFIGDHSSHNQDDNRSYVDLLVVGLTSNGLAE